MSRASEITLFIIILQAAIGFVDATGMFSHHYLGDTQNNASYTITDLDAYSTQTEEGGISGIVSEIDLYAHWAWEAFFIGLKIVFAVVFILPTLVTKFNVPVVLSVFIQAGIYYIYAIWFAQYKSGKGWKFYE